MAAELTGLVRVRREHVGSAARTLAEAFRDDPQMVHFFPDASERKKLLPHFMEFLLRYGVRWGEVYASSAKMEAVAAWLPAERARMALWPVIRAGGARLLLEVGRKPVAKMRSAAEFLWSVHRRRAPSPHWYLSVIGVTPASQGRSHATDLVAPMLARLDGEGLGCYLETQNEKNLAIYERYGFRVVEEGVIPGGGVKFWAMLRERRP